MNNQRYETSDYYMYVPDNITNNCGVVVYYPGAGGAQNGNSLYGDATLDGYINSNPGKIVVVNKLWDTSSDSVIQGLNNIQQTYNTNVGDINIYSASRGDHSIFKAAENFNNNGFHTSNIAILDTSYVLKRQDGDSNYGIVIDDKLAKNLADNGTSVLIASQYDKRFLDQSNMQELINAGVPITHIHVMAPQDNYHINYTAHTLIKEEFIKNGIMDFLAGDKDSLDSNWTYSFNISKYDYDGGVWIDNLSEDEFNQLFHTMSAFNHLDTRYDYLKTLELYDINSLPALLGYSSNSVTSEIKYVVNEMNNIRKIVSNTQFLGVLGNKLGNVSANNPVLEYENDLVSTYFDITGNFLNKVSFLTDAIVNVAFVIDNMDDALSQTANQMLNNNRLIAQNLTATGYSNNPYNLSQALLRNLNHGYTVNLGKYSENLSAGFQLRLSNRVYTLNDFNSSYAMSRWGYDSKLAREAFIGVCIAECDKTPDGALSVATVALNRCESNNWSSYYTKSDSYGTTDGTNPFDQMFVNGGGQYSVITSGAYRRYMPSIAGRDNIDAYLAQYNTTYAELEQAVDDALQGGVRNSYYTGFRANTPQYSGAKLDPARGFCNVFMYENYNVDSLEAQNAQAKLVSMPLSGTSYSGMDSIMVSTDNTSVSNVSVSPSGKPVISFVQTPSVGNGAQNLGISDGSGTSNPITASTPTQPITPVKPMPTVVTSTPKPVDPVVSVNGKTVEPSVSVEPTVSSGGGSVAEPVTSVNSSSVEIPPVVSSEPIETANTSSTVNASPSVSGEPSIVVEPERSTNTITSNPIEEPVSEVTSTSTTNDGESTINSQSHVEPVNVETYGDSRIKTIGIATAGAAALGGIVYAGGQVIKKIKDNQTIDDNESEDEDAKDGDDK